MRLNSRSASGRHGNEVQMNSQARGSFQGSPENIERDLANMKEGLSLLGIRACSNCGKFFRSSSASDTFSFSGETVCFDCLESWWAALSPTLDLATRNAFEQKLMRWLIDHYDAVVVRDPASLPPSQQADFQLVVNCHECAGTGLLGKTQCRHCRGNKMIWVVVNSRHS
jgi:hypothetical protein